MNSKEILGGVCLIIKDIPHTFISGVWTAIVYGFSAYWFLLIPGLISWLIFEFVFKNNHGFNSENGFTPFFNSIVGGGVFYLFDTLIYFVLGHLIGKSIYCVALGFSSFYLIPFILTGLFLHGIGFWPYLKIPFTKIKIEIF